MKEFVEKLIERLEQLKADAINEDCPIVPNSEDCEMEYSCASCHLSNAIKIVNELGEEYKQDLNKNKQGWIPCSERLPDTDEYILLSFENFSIPVVGRYEENEEGVAFYAGDEDESCIKQDMFVNAWMSLPEPYSATTSQNLATEQQKEIPTNHYIERFIRVN